MRSDEGRRGEGDEATTRVVGCNAAVGSASAAQPPTTRHVTPRRMVMNGLARTTGSATSSSHAPWAAAKVLHRLAASFGQNLHTYQHATGRHKEIHRYITTIGLLLHERVHAKKAQSQAHAPSARPVGHLGPCRRLSVARPLSGCTPTNSYLCVRHSRREAAVSRV